MRSFFVLLPLALAGCPPPRHYLIADITAGNAPVADAVVASDCSPRYDGSGAAMRTDETGRARLLVSEPVHGARCTVTVAKPGYRTVETERLGFCTTPACPPMQIDLLPPHAPYVPQDPYAPDEAPIAPPIAPPIDTREYARPPLRGAR